MRTLRAASLLLAFLAATGLVFGTFAFSAMSADRGLDLGVTDDDSAYVGYAELTDAVHDGESTETAEFRNQFQGDLDAFEVDVSLKDPEGTGTEIVDVDAPSDGLDATEAESVTVTLQCSVEEEVTLVYEAQGSSAGVSVSLDREHDVTCVPKEPYVTGVTFNDAANAHFEWANDDRDGSVEAIVWTKPTPASSEADADDLDAETVELGPNDPNLNNVLVPPDNDTDDVEGNAADDTGNAADDTGNAAGNAQDRKLVAIEFPDRGEAFFHPGWDAGTHDSPSSGDGVRVNATAGLDAETVANTSVVEDDG